MFQIHRGLPHIILGGLIIHNYLYFVFNISMNQALCPLEPLIVIVPSYILLFSGKKAIGIAGIHFSICLLLPSIIPLHDQDDTLIASTLFLLILLGLINLLHQTVRALKDD